jgi:hypothetical protein
MSSARVFQKQGDIIQKVKNVVIFQPNFRKCLIKDTNIFSNILCKDVMLRVASSYINLEAINEIKLFTNTNAQ